MNKNTNLVKETEKFSFIRTINIYCYQNNILKKPYYITDNKNQFHKKETVEYYKDNQYAALYKNNQQNSLNTLLNENTAINNSWYSIEKSKYDYNYFKYKGIKENKNNFSKNLFLLFAISYLGFIFWIIFGSKNAILDINFIKRKETVSQADIEFIEYINNSLSTIDRRLAKKHSSASKIDSLEKNLKVVYMPIYTPGKAPVPKENIKFPQLDSILPPPPINQLQLKSNPPISSAISIKPPASPSESIEIKTKPIEKSATVSEVKKAIVKPNITHTLIGVIELKEGSAALFKTDGVTQRIWLGEKIENTNWILNSVIDQKATISDKNNTLILNVGESFQ